MAVSDDCLKLLVEVAEALLDHRARYLLAGADAPCRAALRFARAWSWSWMGVQSRVLDTRRIPLGWVQDLDVGLESLGADNSSKDPEDHAASPWMVWGHSRPPRGLGLGLCLLVFLNQYPGCPSARGCCAPRQDLSSAVCLGMSGKGCHRILARLEIFETGSMAVSNGSLDRS